MNNPFFSIIIPTRNRVKDFNIALDSVLNQTCKDIEIIVVNDGSSPNHLIQYKEIANIHKNRCILWINLIEREIGHGHCFARNQGVASATGKYIGFLDDDDYWCDKDFLSRVKSQLNSHKIDVYYANQKAISHEGKEIPDLWISNLPNKLPSNDQRINQEVFEVSVSEILLAGGFPHQNCTIMKKELYAKIGGMDENLRYEPDLDVYLRTLDKCKGILVDTNTVSVHNVPNKEQKSNASTKTSFLEKKLFQLRTAEKGILFAEREEVKNYCITRKGYLIKQVSEELVKKKKWELASKYALEGLVISPSIKWLLFTFYCYLRGVFYKY